jgi:5-methylcytosine-specific restriction endonuclease McrA
VADQWRIDVDESTTKRCKRCDTMQPIAEFHKWSRGKDGLQTNCKQCKRDMQRSYRTAKPEKARAFGRESMRRRRLHEPERVRDYMKAWRAANAESVREVKRAWEAANYEAFRAAANAANARYKRSNPDKRREHDLRRRALKIATAVGDVDLLALWESQGGLCGLCALPLDRTLVWPDPKSPSIDHIKPLSRGGAHEQSNCQWACLDCNLRKGARTI